MAKAKHGSIFKHAVRPRLDRHHGGSRSPLVGGLDTDRQTVFCAHRGRHFRSGPIGGLSWLLTQRFAHAESTALFSKFVLANVFIWHMILLPILLF